MGYYVETGTANNKAKIILERNADAKVVTQEEADVAMQDATLGVIVVVDNGPFEAAAFAFNDAEYQAFTSPQDGRPKTFLVMPRATAKKLSGYCRE